MHRPLGFAGGAARSQRVGEVGADVLWLRDFDVQLRGGDGAARARRTTAGIVAKGPEPTLEGGAHGLALIAACIGQDREPKRASDQHATSSVRGRGEGRRHRAPGAAGIEPRGVTAARGVQRGEVTALSGRSNLTEEIALRLGCVAASDPRGD